MIFTTRSVRPATKANSSPAMGRGDVGRGEGALAALFVAEGEGRLARLEAVHPGDEARPIGDAAKLPVAHDGETDGFLLPDGVANRRVARRFQADIVENAGPVRLQGRDQGARAQQAADVIGAERGAIARRHRRLPSARTSIHRDRTRCRRQVLAPRGNKS